MEEEDVENILTFYLVLDSVVGPYGEQMAGLMMDKRECSRKWWI